MKLGMVNLLQPSGCSYVMLRVRPALEDGVPTRDPPFNFGLSAIQQSGSSYQLSRLNRESVGVDCTHIASFIISSMVWLAR